MFSASLLELFVVFPSLHVPPLVLYPLKTPFHNRVRLLCVTPVHLLERRVDPVGSVVVQLFVVLLEILLITLMGVIQEVVLL